MTYRLRNGLEVTGDVAVTGDLTVDGYFDVTDSNGSPMFGNQAYKNIGTSIQTFYVRADGYDDTGDGLTIGTAWRQPQRALDEIPDDATGTFHVDCGPGTFEVPMFNRKLNTDSYDLRVFIWGDRSAPDIAPDAVLTWSAVAGTSARARANVGAYGATITASSHWLEEIPDTYPYLIGYSAPLLDSVSPNIDIPLSGSLTSYVGRIKGVHPFATTFNHAANRLSFPSGIGGAREPGRYSNDQLVFAGIEFGTGIGMLRNCTLKSCKISEYITLSNVGASAIVSSLIALEDNCYFSYCILHDEVHISNGVGSFTSVVMKSGSKIKNADSRACSLAFFSCDIEAGSDGLEITNMPGVIIGAAVTCVTASPPAKLMTASNCSIKFQNPVNGTCTGVPIVLTNGSIATGVGASVSIANSGSAGDEITIGSATYSFSDLPITDATSQCKAV